ncbi:MAG TPA: YraN family protein [Mycobacteriales bacterium]|nr:YraN family protein [Mycobacteriales bacterium]
MQAKDGLGRYGERVALRHLIEAGHEILDRNWRCADGEIDIVSRCEGVITFVEVKTRRSGRFGEPAEAVGLRKQTKIRELAAIWLREHTPQPEAGPGAGPRELSFDVIEVRHAERGAASVTHLRQAF